MVAPVTVPSVNWPVEEMVTNEDVLFFPIYISPVEVEVELSFNVLLNVTVEGSVEAPSAKVILPVCVTITSTCPLKVCELVTPVLPLLLPINRPPTVVLVNHTESA